MINIGYKLLSLTAKAPVIAHEGTDDTMGIDVFTSEQVSLRFDTCDKYHPHDSILPYANIPTGIALDLPKGVHVSWGGRSGLAFKEGIMPFEGKIDSNYCGELMVKIWSMNPTDEHRIIPAGTKIAQLYIIQYTSTFELKEVNDVRISSRGTAGFGSTGTK